MTTDATADNSAVTMQKADSLGGKHILNTVFKYWCTGASF